MKRITSFLALALGLVILSAAPCSAVTKQISITIDNSLLGAVRLYIGANFLQQAAPGADPETCSDGSCLTNQQIINWFESKAQEVVRVFAGRAASYAEDNDASTLPAAYATRLAARKAEQAKIDAIRSAAGLERSGRRRRAPQ